MPTPDPQPEPTLAEIAEYHSDMTLGLQQYWPDTRHEAAARQLLALAGEVKGLREALRPFAAKAEQFDSTEWGPRTSGLAPLLWTPERAPYAYDEVTIGDCRRARAACAAPPAGPRPVEQPRDGGEE